MPELLGETIPLHRHWVLSLISVIIGIYGLASFALSCFSKTVFSQDSVAYTFLGMKYTVWYSEIGSIAIFSSSHGSTLVMYKWDNRTKAFSLDLTYSTLPEELAIWIIKAFPLQDDDYSKAEHIVQLQAALRKRNKRKKFYRSVWGKVTGRKNPEIK